jgi:hypothetical protein
VSTVTTYPITLTLVPWPIASTVNAYPRVSDQILPDLPPTGVPVVDSAVVAADHSLSFDLPPGVYWAVAPLTAGQRDYRYVGFRPGRRALPARRARRARGGERPGGGQGLLPRAERPVRHRRLHDGAAVPERGRGADDRHGLHRHNVDFLVGTFATDPGVPGAVDYPAGTGQRSVYARVSAGAARLHVQVYKRTAAGVETLVRDEFSPSFSDLAVTLQEWAAASAVAGTLLATDRLVVKLYAQRVSGGASITVTTYFEGSLHASQIQTTISAGAQGPIGPQGPAGLPSPFRTSHGYVIGGTLDAALVVPDLHIAKSATQASTLISLIAKIESGTSIDVTVRRNGSAVGTAKTVTTTKQTFSYSQALADGDALDLTLANPVGTPADLGATLVVEHVIT